MRDTELMATKKGGKRAVTNRRRIAVAGLLGVYLICTAQMCSQSAQRKLLKAEDDAAVLIGKAEQARTIALKENRIDQATATNIDRALLRINTAVKRVSKAGDAFAKDSTTGTSEFRAAMRGLRTSLDQFELAIRDGSIGIKNPDSQKAFAGLVASLRSVAAIVEGVIGDLEKK